GLMFLGGEAAYTGYPQPQPGTLTFPDLLPATPGQIVDSINPTTRRPEKTYQTVPTPPGLTQSLMKQGKDPAESAEVWETLNTASNRSRLTGYVKLTPNPNASVYAWASDAN